MKNQTDLKRLADKLEERFQEHIFINGSTGRYDLVFKDYVEDYCSDLDLSEEQTKEVLEMVGF